MSGRKRRPGKAIGPEELRPRRKRPEVDPPDATRSTSMIPLTAGDADWRHAEEAARVAELDTPTFTQAGTPWPQPRDGAPADTCALCGGPIDGYGHNPQPLAQPPARCCSDCNATKVIPARLARGAGERLATRNTAMQGDLPGAEQPGAWRADQAQREVVAAPVHLPADRPGSYFSVNLGAGELTELRGRQPIAPGPGRIDRAARVPEFRAWLIRQWQPGGSFAKAAQAMAETPRGMALHKGGLEALATDADVERRCLQRAELYYVEPPMVDLLAHVAPACPDDVRPTDLTPPAPEGLVVLSRPVMGTAGDSGAPVETWAFTWSPTKLRTGNLPGDAHLAARYGAWVPCLSVTTYRLVDFDRGLTPPELEHASLVATSLDLPVTVHDPGTGSQVLELHGAIWTPMGRSDWPVLDHLAERAPWALDDAMARSITEDRALVAALFTCLAEQHLASQTAERAPRAEARRIARQGLTAADPAKVVIVNLRRPRQLPPEAIAEEDHVGPLPRSHRWLVREHPRWQPCGPGRQERRLTIIPAHVKGPEGTPLIIKQKVRRWVR